MRRPDRPFRAFVDYRLQRTHVRVSYHEAGHCAAALELLGRGSVEFVRMDYNGAGLTRHAGSHRLPTLSRLTITTAARSAEHLAGFSDGDHLSRGDMDSAAECTVGMEISRRVDIWQQALVAGSALVERQRTFIESLAAKLIDRGKLEGPAIDLLWDQYGKYPRGAVMTRAADILKARPLPPPRGEQEEVWDYDLGMPRVVARGGLG
jgi:hypothetical protein